MKLIKNVNIVLPNGKIKKRGSIIIAAGKIKEITDIIPYGEYEEIIDGEGVLTAVPGFVDMHVHLRDPGQTEKEDIFSGCMAAAAGGVTSLLCMPNTEPTIDNPAVVAYINDKAKKATAKVLVAGSITKGLKSAKLCDFAQLKAAGAIAVTDDGRPVENQELLQKALKAAAANGLRLLAHCEDLKIVDGGIVNKGEASQSLGVKGIDRESENKGTQLVIDAAEQTGTSAHICHVSTAEAVEMIAQAKRRGVKITAETAPHYFAFTEKELLQKKDADYRMNPPLRTENDRQAVIKGLKNGTIDAIATDHAPHTVAEKSNFLTAPNGSIGMETSFAAGYTYLVLPGLLTLPELIKKMSDNPAAILGIAAGKLEVGATADIVLLNTNKKWTVDPLKLHGKSQNTPFKGLELAGKVAKTILNGKVVFDEAVDSM
ncbi:MAG: dihydroorotase [Oscillospiraceae bacterium]|jgi:dihydroorotase|nr:dihydroorotase [Oscillospiraceae bacterium]